MASLAESVMSGAQGAQDQQAHTVGDAVNAYQIASQTANARQQLDIQKQENERNKANWVASQLAEIGRQNGNPNTQKVLLDSFARQAPTVLPGFDPNINGILKDSENARNLGFHAQNLLSAGGVSTPEEAQSLIAIAGNSVEAAKLAQSIGEQRTKLAAAQFGVNASKQQMIDQVIHTNATKAVADSPLTRQLVTTYQNLDNAINNFQKGGETPQEFQELQSSVRSNLGIKGTSGVDERSETYLKSLGINIDKMSQFLSGKLQNVAQTDPDFANQVVNLARMEQHNKQKQAIQMIDRDAARYAGYYKMRPGLAPLKGDLDNVVSQTKGLFQSQSAGQPPQQDASQGTIKNPDGSVTYQGVTYAQQNGQWVPQASAQSGGQ